MTERKDLLKKIEGHKKAYYEHLEKAQRYTGWDRDYALKTAERIKREILRLCEEAGIEPDL
ncbi:MAG: hypothetical protein AB1816_03120 [Bacillota bacterium]